MHKLLTTAFPHRHKADGSHVAICRRCFATLASVKNEGELELYEVQHKCDRLTLYQSLFPAPKRSPASVPDLIPGLFTEPNLPNRYSAWDSAYTCVNSAPKKKI